MSIFKLIIKAIFDIFAKLIGNAEAEKERAKSVEESYAEQEKARIEAEKAKASIEQGKPDDVLGADAWNKKDA